MLDTLASPFPREAFATAYTRASRILGGAPIELNRDEQDTLSSAGLPLFQGRPLHELGRTVLLLGAIEHLRPQEQPELVDELFVRGDNAEREAVLRTLPLLPDPSRFLATAVEACRTNVQTVFETIACENPYPARFFPELSFNQMVMKAVFTGVSLRRIVGLPARVTPALVSMAGDYGKERTAAGRPVNEDLGLIMTTP